MTQTGKQAALAALNEYVELVDSVTADFTTLVHAMGGVYDHAETFRAALATPTAAPSDAEYKLIENLHQALIFVMPMAKGYAAANRVGSNQAMIDNAKEVMREADAYLTAPAKKEGE